MTFYNRAGVAIAISISIFACGMNTASADGVETSSKNAPTKAGACQAALYQAESMIRLKLVQKSRIGESVTPDFDVTDKRCECEETAVQLTDGKEDHYWSCVGYVKWVSKE